MKVFSFKIVNDSLEMSYSSFYQYDTGPTQLEKDFVEAVTFNNLAILQQLFDNIENEDDQEFVDGLNFQMIPYVFLIN